MNRCIFFLFFCQLTTGLLWAENRENEVSKDTIRLDEVVVTGSMPKVNLRNVPMSISVVSEERIEGRMQPSLLPLLTEEVPGLFIAQRGVMGYGVANGAAGGMSIRGIGGAPTVGVLVLIDGHPQYMGLMGHPLADSYQSMMTERVEVVRGPASMLYGSNAMGGVINIITKKQKADGSHHSAQLSYGSYNTLSAEFSSGYRKKQFHANGNVGYNRSDGHRMEMDFEQFSGYLKTGYEFNTNWSSFVDLNLSKTVSSNPGPITNQMIDNDADVLRGMASVAIENEYDKTSGAVKFFYNFGSHEINDGIPVISSALPPVYRFRSNYKMFGFKMYESYSLFDGNKTTAGFDYQRYGGKAWNKFPDEANNVDLADVHLNNIAGYLNLQQNILQDRLTLNAGVRLDHHQKNGSEWIPQFGLSFTPTATTSVKAIASKGFRNPTIREMYMFPPQNADLKPERLMNYEISLLQAFPEKGISIGLNLFYINGDNMIRQPQPNVGKWENTGEVENKGFELSMNYRATDNLRFSANYSLLDMTYAIAGAPKHKFNLNGDYSIARWSLSTGLQYLGSLYTKVNPEPVAVNVLLWNVRINYNVTNGVSLFIRGENLLNQDYEINAGYPMPGATLFGGIRVHI
jgi:outer membrane cobalamin receptor